MISWSLKKQSCPTMTVEGGRANCPLLLQYPSKAGPSTCVNSSSCRSHPPPGHVVARALQLASSPGRVFGCKKGRDIPSKILVAIPDTEIDCIMYPSLKNASWLSRWTNSRQMRCNMIHYALCIFRENPKQLVQRCP